VTPIDTLRRPDEQRQQLEGHNYAGLPLTTVHESYPGHSCAARPTTNPRPARGLRRLADSNLFAEAGRSTSEELMHEQGFFL
jgi:hypothetical protein